VGRNENAKEIVKTSTIKELRMWMGLKTSLNIIRRRHKIWSLSFTNTIKYCFDTWSILVVYGSS